MCITYDRNLQQTKKTAKQIRKRAFQEASNVFVQLSALFFFI
ncbi:hypothetical protein BCE_3374 [Bacillus cereus ATCC 10987]|uniref:Uncharacterized protein n=1 Tax=Bacillus cereus (strain ATCC 10987 / NRS 248) TaxID=222523 RepID=Q734N0_BACC1|nr:hypothetical protein BCE_3374 [Bacillus cereus ATCC 10987]